MRGCEIYSVTRPSINYLQLLSTQRYIGLHYKLKALLTAYYLFHQYSCFLIDSFYCAVATCLDVLVIFRLFSLHPGYKPHITNHILQFISVSLRQRNCAKSRKIAGSIPHQVIGFSNCSNLPSSTMALGAQSTL
jgi:hypothetical protein